MIIKKYKQFSESISGTELVGRHMGPNYPEQQVDNTTLGQSQTNVIYSEITSKIYTYDDYQDLYQDYLKIGGTPLHGFNQENLTTVLTFANR